jgi:hypothetical protein
LDELVVIRQDVDDILIDISVDVGAKKIHLDETVKTLTSAVDVAISQVSIIIYSSYLYPIGWSVWGVVLVTASL